MADTQDEVATKSVEVEKLPISHEQKQKFVSKKCCFCLPRRTGCLILAYFFLVGAIVSEIYYILGTASLIFFMSNFPDHVHHIKSITILVINLVVTGLGLLAILFNVLLVIGLHKEKRSFVRLFVRFQLIYIILYALPYICAIILGYADILSIVLGLTIFVLNIFYGIVIWSQYLKTGTTVSSEPVGLYKDGNVVITP